MLTLHQVSALNAWENWEKILHKWNTRIYYCLWENREFDMFLTDIIYWDEIIHCLVYAFCWNFLVPFMVDLHFCSFFFVCLRAWFNEKTNWFSPACFKPQMMQDVLRYTEDIYFQMLGISEFIHNTAGISRAKRGDEDMLNNKMYFISKEHRSDNCSCILFPTVWFAALSMKS